MAVVKTIYEETTAQHLKALRAFFDGAGKNISCTLEDFIYGIKPLLVLTANILSQVARGASVFIVHAAVSFALFASILFVFAQLSYLIGIYFPLPGGSVSAVFDAPFWIFNVTDGFWGVFGDISFGFLVLIFSLDLVYIAVGKSCDLGKIAQNKTGKPVRRYYDVMLSVAVVFSIFIGLGLLISTPKRVGGSLESDLADIYLKEFKSQGIEYFSFVQKDNNKGQLVVKLNGSTHTWEGDTSSFEYSYGLSNDHDEYDGPYYVTEKFQGRYRFDIRLNSEKGKDAFIASGNGFLKDNDEGRPDLEVKLERAKWMIKTVSSLAKGPSNEERELMSKENG